jgi:predicted tellurium resistance membrane protein TerC
VEIWLLPETWVSLLVLTLMEMVLGIDNIVFITILTGRVEESRRDFARRAGLAVALVARVAMLAGIQQLTMLTEPAVHRVRGWSGRDIVLALGGLFLLYKATSEIFHAVEHPDSGQKRGGAASQTLASVLAQIFLLDLVFSLDSVITAVGMADHLGVMAIAILASVLVMMLFAGAISNFVEANPSVKLLALAFLVLIGAMLTMEATGQHVPKGYLYSAIAFSLFVQMLNLRRERRQKARAA